MKNNLVLTLAITLLMASSSAYAKKKKAQTWDDKKAKLAILNEEQKQKVIDALPAKASADTKTPRRALIFYRCEGYVHGSIAIGNYALQQLGKQTGAFTADLADDYNTLSKANLANYDVLIFNNTTRLKISPALQKTLLDFISSGKGIVGIHAASDNFYDWGEGIALMGGVFSGHPWNAGGTWAFKNETPDNVLNQGFAGKDFMHKDEIYCYKDPIDRENITVLVSLDMSKKVNQDAVTHERWAKKYEGVNPSDIDNPVSWFRSYGMGRLFYTNFGHNDATFSTSNIMQHLLDGIQFAAGDLSVSK